jgi:uncharacterized protein YjbI with pentapeptide repeats
MRLIIPILAGFSLLFMAAPVNADPGTQTRALAALAACAGCTIEHADFSQTNLAGIRLNGATLRDVNLQGADLSGAQLSGVTLINVRLDDATLSNATFDGANVSSSSFRGAALDGTRFQGVNFDHNVFVRARLHGAGVFGSRLLASDLRDADLGGADLASSDLAGSNLRGADLAKSILCQTANENSTENGRIVTHKRVMRCVGLKGADVGGVRFETGLACDDGNCTVADPTLIRRSNGAG